MTFEKVNYISIPSDCLIGKEEKEHKLLEKLREIILKLNTELQDRNGWLRLRSGNDFYYYNRSVRGLFPDLSQGGWTAALWEIREMPDVNSVFTRLKLAGMRASLVTKKELRDIFVSPTVAKSLVEHWEWNQALLGRYFAVLPCEMNAEICRIDGGDSAYWGMESEEKACIIPIAHLTNYCEGGNWQDDILFLMKKGIIPLFGGKTGEEDSKFLNDYSQFLHLEKGEFQFIQRALEQAQRDGKWPGHDAVNRVIKPDEDLKQKIEEMLLQCDYKRVSLRPYDKNLLSPPNGHWELWKHVEANPKDNPPTPGKIWADVSDESIYARNPAADIAFSSEAIAIDFGTKSTTVARVDDRGTIVTVPIGEYGSSGTIGEKGYENPTILRFINFADFKKSYDILKGEGRPETNFNDLSASYTAENSFRQRSLNGNESDVFSYLYQIKQWAYNNAFEPLIFDRHGRIPLEPYREIKKGDLDPIEIYAYMVGLNVVNMWSKKIFTRYLLSYPSSCSREICEKIRGSFERGIRKAIPSEAQKDSKFQQDFSVQLWQTEPAAYAVCAIKEFNIPRKYDALYCSVYDLGGGTVDYHYGFFIGKKPPYQYEELESGGNGELGCENILEQLAYEKFSSIKDQLAARGIKYEYPPQYPSGLKDVRYTSNSRQAKLNTLGMIDALREIWINNFKPDYLGQFEVYSETSKDVYYIRMSENGSINDSSANKSQANAAESAKNPASAEKDQKESKMLNLTLNMNELKQFFSERIEKTIDDFLKMMDSVYPKLMVSIKKKLMDSVKKNDLPDIKIRSVIFLAGNGSKSPLVKELFEKKMKDYERSKDNCELYPPLFSEEAKEKGQKTEKRIGSIPTAKSGVAHGLLISRPGSDFVRILRRNSEFVFRYYLGESHYDVEKEASIFHVIRKPGDLKLRDRNEENVEENEFVVYILEEGYLQFWFTDSRTTRTNCDGISLSECGARQFLIRVPDYMISKKSNDKGIRGECYCQAVSETELKIRICSIDDRSSLHNAGFLNLENGGFSRSGLRDDERRTGAKNKPGDPGNY